MTRSPFAGRWSGRGPWSHSRVPAAVLKSADGPVPRPGPFAGDSIVTIRLALLTFVAAGLAAFAAEAQYVYPAKGQSSKQQQKDTGECKSWAASQGGTTPPPAQGQVAKGAARGAVGGAVIAGVADGDSGKGAAAGAVVGSVRAGRQKQAQAGAAQQDAGRAFAACMEGRGYTVK